MRNLFAMGFPIDQLPLKALILTFPEMDVLDIIGPLEGFSRTLDKKGDSVYQVTIAGETRVHTAQWATLSPDITLDCALETCGDYDLLLMPGGPSPVVEALLHPENKLVKTVKKFSELKKRSADEEDRPRILLSICTGAFVLAYLGIFQKGWQCTTHYQAADTFDKILKKHSPGAKYVETTYVDSGYLDNGINVIDSGGISNGIDGGLYVTLKYFDDYFEQPSDEPRKTPFYDTATAIMDYRNMMRCGIPCIQGCKPRCP